MLLDQDPGTVIQTYTTNFRIESDKACLDRIKGSLETLSQARNIRIDHLQEDLSRLSRQLALVQNQHRVVVSDAGATVPLDQDGREDFTSSETALQLTDRHTEELDRLDMDKFRIAKQANELEIEGERLERELEALKARLAELDSLDDDDRGHGFDGDEAGASGTTDADDSDETVLKLKVYRSLGIDVEPADPVTGQYTKAVIRNSQRGDVHVVNIDPKFSRYFYANYFWQTLG